MSFFGDWATPKGFRRDFVSPPTNTLLSCVTIPRAVACWIMDATPVVEVVMRSSVFAGVFLLATGTGQAAPIPASPYVGGELGQAGGTSMDVFAPRFDQFQLRQGKGK